MKPAAVVYGSLNVVYHYCGPIPRIQASSFGISSQRRALSNLLSVRSYSMKKISIYLFHCHRRHLRDVVAVVVANFSTTANLANVTGREH